jgi:hypothetical protein
MPSCAYAGERDHGALDDENDADELDDIVDINLTVNYQWHPCLSRGHRR